MILNNYLLVVILIDLVHTLCLEVDMLKRFWEVEKEEHPTEERLDHIQKKYKFEASSFPPEATSSNTVDVANALARFRKVSEEGIREYSEKLGLDMQSAINALVSKMR